MKPTHPHLHLKILNPHFLTLKYQDANDQMEIANVTPYLY